MSEKNKNGGLFMNYRKLIDIAVKARENAYAKYSGFMVGAALLCEDGKVFTGCNVENLSYSLTNCAERTAIFKAVSKGNRKFKAIAVVGAPDGKKYDEDFCFPCGACLQVMSEFCDDDFEVILCKEGNIKVFKFCELMPNVFSSEF